jgi:hypothetical protein
MRGFFVALAGWLSEGIDMAEVSITASAVQPVTTGDDQTVSSIWTAGATIAAGQWLYKDTANSNVMKLAQGDGTSLEGTVFGMALNSASSGQPVNVATGGRVTVGSVVTAGIFYFLSSTAGNMELFSDVTAGENTSQVAYATAATIVMIYIKNTDIDKA